MQKNSKMEINKATDKDNESITSLGSLLDNISTILQEEEFFDYIDGHVPVENFPSVTKPADNEESQVSRAKELLSKINSCLAKCRHYCTPQDKDELDCFFEEVRVINQENSMLELDKLEKLIKKGKDLLNKTKSDAEKAQIENSQKKLRQIINEATAENKQKTQYTQLQQDLDHSIGLFRHKCQTVLVTIKLKAKNQEIKSDKPVFIDFLKNNNEYFEKATLMKSQFLKSEKDKIRTNKITKEQFEQLSKNIEIDYKEIQEKLDSFNKEGKGILKTYRQEFKKEKSHSRRSIISKVSSCASCSSKQIDKSETYLPSPRRF